MITLRNIGIANLILIISLYVIQTPVFASRGDGYFAIPAGGYEVSATGSPREPIITKENMMKARPIDKIPVNELLQYGVWEFDMNEGDYSESQDETWIVPVRKLPVTNLDNRIVFTNLKLANNQTVAGMLGCLELDNIEQTKVFLNASVVKDGEWFHLARYFDSAYDIYGPQQLAEFLGLPIEEVFPISYDISSLAVGFEEVLKGNIPAEPDRRLTDDERMALIFA